MTGAGLYVHIPICSERCGYCHFTTFVEIDPVAYIDALLHETVQVSRAAAVRDQVFDSVYFGGGTPSLLEPRLFARVVEALHENFRIEEPCEFTIEANPEPEGRLAENAEFYASLGVNRVSIGVQSAVAEELAALDRGHSAAQVGATVAAVRPWIQNINLDILLGVPRQTPASLDCTLGLIEDLAPAHVSAYVLETSPGSPLCQAAPSDDDAAALYDRACCELKRQRFGHYEICNFAQPGRECLHNLKYWDGTPYVGLGVSAASLYGGERITNASNLAGYIDDPARERTITRIDEDALSRETIFLQLRTARGLDRDLFRRRYGYDPIDRFRVDWEDLIDAGLVVSEEGRYFIPEERMLLGNEVFVRFL